MVKMRKLKVWANTTDSTRPRCLYQARKVIAHVFCVLDLTLFTIFLLDYATVLTV